MKTRLVMLSALVLHAAIGGVCTMPMTAMAAGTHDDDVMAMSHMDSMPSHDCDRCSHAEGDKNHSPAPCDGHCISQGDAAVVTPLPLVTPPVAALPSTPQTPAETLENDIKTPETDEPPGAALLARTVVLRE